MIINIEILINNAPIRLKESSFIRIENDQRGIQNFHNFSCRPVPINRLNTYRSYNIHICTFKLTKFN